MKSALNLVHFLIKNALDLVHFLNKTALNSVQIHKPSSRSVQLLERFLCSLLTLSLVSS